MVFLEQIYDKGYYPSEDVQPEPTEEYTQAKAKVMKLTDIIISKLGDGGEELFDEFLSAKADQVSIELSTAFAVGARFAGKVFVDCCKQSSKVHTWGCGQKLGPTNMVQEASPCILVKIE